MGLMQIEVPDGVGPGDPMSVFAGDQEFTITVPDGVGPGMLIEVDLPVDEQDPGGPSGGGEPETEPVIVEVPDGLYPGDMFQVTTEWGGTFEIQVPDGVGPGEQIQVELPTAASQGRAAAAAAAAARDHAVGASSAAARACGLIAKAILNGRKGTVRSYNPDKDRLVVTIDGMHPDVAVAFRNLKELPPDDAVMHLPDTEPPEAPPAGVHYVGDRVKVERSNGSISYATIVEYDEVRPRHFTRAAHASHHSSSHRFVFFSVSLLCCQVMEVYTVDVGGGVLKYGVEESYITHVDHTGEWAGKHFIGRKVRLPHLSGRDADKQGTIRGHNERRDEYTVLLENGRTVGQLKFEQMKVPYELIKR